MRDPFKIDGPTCISFSGGRSSGYMLHRVLDSNGGLPEDSFVVFANTGKEDEATLVFVRECAEQWDIPITWVEFDPKRDDGFRVATFDTASREGEPFAELIRIRKYLPNPVARFCTVELKILPAVAFMRSLGYMEHDNLIGMRADEPARLAKIRASPSGGTKGIERYAPLGDAGISKWNVIDFWREQSFDLGLPVVNGKTMHGNCDLCFLKPPAQRLSLIRERPTRAVWWISQEASIQLSKIKDGARFTKDGPSYAQMLAYAEDQDEMFDPNEEAIACFCGD